MQNSASVDMLIQIMQILIQFTDISNMKFITQMEILTRIIDFEIKIRILFVKDLLYINCNEITV